jgi:hypothetical protein
MTGLTTIEALRVRPATPPMPITDPLELSYALHLLPRGRVAFRRWRWELWHGPQLLAAGWRLSALQAQRALGGHAFRYIHRMHGLHPLRPDADAAAPDTTWSGRPVALNWGPLGVVLSPRPA